MLHRIAFPVVSEWCQTVPGIRVLYLSDEGRTGESQLVGLRNMRVCSLKGPLREHGQYK